MSKYTKQDTIEEEGRKLFQGSLNSNFFLLNDFASPSGKDRYPDIDGQIRLRDGSGNYLDLYLHYQLKSTSKLHIENYYCDGKIIDYLLSTNIPTILIVVDIVNKKVYWFFLGDDQKKKFSLNNIGNSGRTVDLSSNLIIPENNLILSKIWQGLAKEDDYIKINDSINKITSSFQQDIHKCLGLLYLLQSVPKDEVADSFNSLIKIEKSEIERILPKLVNEGIISETANFYLIDNEQLGIESLYKFLTELNFTSIDATFKEKNERKKILGQLAKIEHLVARSYLAKSASELLEYVKVSTSNDVVFVKLELLYEYAFRVPTKVVEIIKAILSANPIPAITTELKGFGLVEGKSHQDLIQKGIEILNRIRYQEPEVFKILIELSQREEESINEKALKALENLSKYNVHALKHIGFKVQLFILDELETWDSSKIIRSTNVLIHICKELLEPSYEDTSMSDYRTITFQSGSLNPTSGLQNIRKRTLKILNRIYLLNHDLIIKKKILTTFQKATQTPHTANYGNDMENMVRENTNIVIEYYLSFLEEADNDLIKDIDEQAFWFSRHFGSEKLPKLSELNNAIASKTQYDMFKVFVGFDGRFDADMEWEQVKKMREEKIQIFIHSITKSSLPEWQEKILSVIKNYSESEPGEFQYFNYFLFQFAKQKPTLAQLLINNPKLEPFLIHLIAGIWSSPLQTKGKKIINDWIKSGKNLSICAQLFDSVGSLDEKILNKIFRKAMSVKDIDSLNNILASIIRNYQTNKNLKSLFIKTIAELTKYSNCEWINHVWYRGDAILKDFNDADFEIILKNLLQLPNIGFHAEEILLPIAEKNPKKLFTFFNKRILIDSKRDKNIDDHYDSIPFEFHKINKPLQQHEQMVVSILLTWYTKGNFNTRWLFRWEASHLFNLIFPSFSPILEQTLIGMIENDKKGVLELVFSILSKYQDQDCVWNVVKTIIETYRNNKKYTKIEKNLFSYLSQTGTVSGEYGFVEALQNKKQQLQKFKDDTRESVKVFIKNYENYLYQRIDYEKKRADEDIEFRKREIA